MVSNRVTMYGTGARRKGKLVICRVVLPSATSANTYNQVVITQLAIEPGMVVRMSVPVA